MSCLLSIIIPVYQVEAYLKRCVDSVLAQKFQSYEIILVNDGSPDSSPEICDDYAQQYPHISVIHKPNGGLSEARNVGLLAARGEYVFFPDSDDWLISTMLEEVSEVITSKEYDIIEVGIQMYHSYDDKRDEQPKKETVLSGTAALQSMLSYKEVTSFAANKIYRKSLFIDHEIFFPVGAFYEDLGTIYKLLLVADKVYDTNQVYYCYYLGNENSITKSWSDKKFEDMYRFYNEIYSVSSGVSDVDAIVNKAHYANGLVYLLAKMYECHQEKSKLFQVISKELVNTRVPIYLMKTYPTYLKYVCYRLGILKYLIRLKYYLKG